MKALVLMDERHVVAGNAFVEIVIWEVPQPVRRSVHRLKYRLALVADGECVIRYDNEAGKGDHRHVGRVETPLSVSKSGEIARGFLVGCGRLEQT